MHVGMSAFFQNLNGTSDAEVYRHEVAMADMAEPLGFDSIWSAEHHFDHYTMCPNVMQFLTYMAGRTTRAKLGSMVVVLPWHDPIRVAEQIALLDVISGGRTLLGFGRGAATVEYEGFRIPMDEARPRFKEGIEIIQRGLTQPSFEYDGQFFKIPRTSIRPAPISHPETRFYGSANSPESAKLIASLGMGHLIVMHNEWSKAAHEVYDFHKYAMEAGHQPRPPIILTNVSCATSRDEASDRAVTWLGKKWDSVDNHYRFSDGGLSNVKGYEGYSKIGRTYAKMNDLSYRARMTDTYVKIQIIGTPDDCIQQVAELRQVTGLHHLVCEFGYGGLPHHEAEVNMRLFAEKVRPVLQSDAAFVKEPDIITSTPELKESGVFVPA